LSARGLLAREAGMAQICVTLGEENTVALIDRMVDLDAHADLFEIRGDLVRDLDLLTLLRARSKPLVFTCRAVSEGGKAKDAHPERKQRLLEAAKRGFEYVDVEHRLPNYEVVAARAGKGLIVSFHDLTGVPEDLDRLYAEMCKGGADVVKIVVTPRSFAEVGRLLGFAARTAAAGGTPLIALALGPLGAPTRILAGRYGAPFTYASAAAGAEAAPGQIPAPVMDELYRVRRISERTRVYGILGADVASSLSPRIHNRAFAACGLDAVYVPLSADSLEAFLSARPALGLAGFSVTRPYKVAILPHLDSVDEEASLAGSVNTVVVEGERLRGFSTDGAGVVAPLASRLALEGASVLVLGAGGAARAAAFALRKEGAAVSLLARKEDQAAEAARAIGCDYGPLASAAKRPFDAVINATPIGGGALAEMAPLAASVWRAGCVAFDMVYDPVETRFLREARTAGATVIGGLEMLLHQAVGQFEAWTGMRAPVEVMRQALFGGEGGPP
jgi:3-dehydroquinate dehydratase/shikimate dehydrogenase